MGLTALQEARSTPGERGDHKSPACNMRLVQHRSRSFGFRSTNETRGREIPERTILPLAAMSSSKTSSWRFTSILAVVCLACTLVAIITVLLAVYLTGSRLPPASSLVPFKEAANGSVLVGSAYNDLRLWSLDSPEEEARYEAVFLKHHDIVTPENGCKVVTIWPAQDAEFNFGPCERLLDWAEENHLDVRFHVLAWGSDALPEHVRAVGDAALPDWMTQLPPEERKGVLTTYITAVLKRLGGRKVIKVWPAKLARP